MLVLTGFLGLVTLQSESVAAHAPHDPIFIDGNAGFTPVNGVTGGSGTPTDPFIISGWEIDASAMIGIEIRNTDARFMIENVYVHSGGSSHEGIKLGNVRNGHVENVESLGNSFGIEISVSTNVSISSSNFSSNLLNGITAVYSDDVHIFSNNASFSVSNGIALSDSTNVSISSNTVYMNQGIGIRVAGPTASVSAQIFHNKIIDNGVQAYEVFLPGSTVKWDDGYPSGGNYWSDYVGSDSFSGPNQDVPGGDGIGDTPYVFTAVNDEDPYPLMQPYDPDALFTLRLNPGHRFVSFPLDVSNTRIESVLSSVAGCYDLVRWYDPADSLDPWKSYMPGRTYNDLTRLYNTMGFWINVTATCSLTLAGTRPVSTAIDLHPGWNMIGFPSFNVTFTVADLKADMGLAGVIVEAFDPAAAPYYLQRVADSCVMRAGEGYWVYVPSDASWIVDG